MSSAPMPKLQYEHAPCPDCGAWSARDAENKCKATQGQDGDYHCAATDCKEDAAGNFLFPTAASVAALDQWYDAEGRKDDAEEAALRDVFLAEAWGGCADLACLPHCIVRLDGGFCQREEEAFRRYQHEVAAAGPLTTKQHGTHQR